MILFIKSLGTILCCIYFFIRILNLRNNRLSCFTFSTFSILLSLLSTFTDTYFPLFTLPFLVLCISIFLCHETKTPLTICITSATIAFALSCICLIISSMLTSFLFIVILKTNTHILAQIICFLLQLTIMHFPFRIKRMQNGMPFLTENIYAFPGMIISILVISTFTLIRFINTYQLNIIRLLPLILLSILIPLIYHYWRSSLTKTYLDTLRQQNLTDLNHAISQQTEHIAELEAENERLSKIIHKDNKLIPYMEYAVYNFLSSRDLSHNDFITTGDKLLKELTTLSTERKGILRQQEKTLQQITSTKVLSIDSLLIYMQQKANKYDIELQVHISCDIPYLIEHVIQEEDLKTLLADLLENAILATQSNNGHYILLSICIVSNTYTISVFDSGIPFTINVLEKWGVEKTTTRRNSGGSGIGLMTTYEIAKGYHASFIIHELGTNNRTFTKEVTLSFNHKSQYILQTSRTEEELCQLYNRFDLQIIRQ